MSKTNIKQREKKTNQPWKNDPKRRKKYLFSTHGDNIYNSYGKMVNLGFKNDDI